MASPDASFRRVPRSLSSALKMSMLMLASTASFHRSIAVCVGAVADDTNARQLLLRGSTPFEDRLLLDPRDPYDFYNDACKSECQGGEDLTLFDSLCPKCPEKYESQHCNHCCFDGASSFRVRWHGCPGEVTFASVEQAVQDCGLETDDRAPADGIRFVECSCYDSINTPETFDASACQPLATTIVLTSSNGIDSDLCIVSVIELGGGDAIIDLSKPLPAVIGLIHTPLSENEEDYTSQYWNPYPLRTYFDTTCSIIDEETAPYVLPLFPGYGKIPGSCPSDGFVDLEEPGTLRLPDEIKHYDGKPSTEPFWYEFVDGTSTGFWPFAEDTGDSSHFDPTFATCSCLECPGTPPSAPSTPAPGPGVPPTPAETTPAPAQSPTPSPVSETTIAPVEPTRSPTVPTPAPQDSPTAAPQDISTPAPQDNPTPAPQVSPTPAPQDNPTPAPQDISSPAPQDSPTPAPQVSSTPAPQDNPTPSPVQTTPSPTVDPNLGGPGGPPSPAPAVPTESPVEPTFSPTAAPLELLTLSPLAPTPAPQGLPTPVDPTPSPTTAPVTIDQPVGTPPPSEHDCPPTPVPTDAPQEPPTNGPTGCEAGDSPLCNIYATNYCLYGNNTGSLVGDRCGFPPPTSSRTRKLEALKAIVNSPGDVLAELSTDSYDYEWFSVDWIMAEKEHHVMASASLRFNM